MSRNGSGVYTLPAGSIISNGDTSDATDINIPLLDIQTDLNTARPVVAGGTGETSISAVQTTFKIPAFDGSASISGDWTVSGAWTFTASPTFNDGVKALFGTGSDLEIYHSGATSIIADVGTGNLEVRATDLVFRNGDGTAVLGGSGSTGWTFRSDAVTRLTVRDQGIDILGDIQLTERADHASTPASGKGIFWVQAGAPSVPIYTDENGTDHSFLNVTASGEIGTYVFARRATNTDVAFGATVAGSDLRTTSAACEVGDNQATVGTATLNTASGLTGTWQCMGTYDSVATGGGTTLDGATLWLRIS